MAKAKKTNRFIITEKQSGFTLSPYVLVDRETGVNYLYINSGYSGGLTVMLGADGKPIVTPILDEE